MKIRIRKFLSIFFIVVLSTTNFAAIATDSIATRSIATKSSTIKSNSNISYSWPKYTGELFSDAAIVMDADSSKVLFEHNIDKKRFPASLAKLMTAIIVFDKLKGNYDDLVTFSYTSVTKDIDRTSATIGASAGDQLSVKDCLYSLLLPSANDAANALAEHVAGNISDFALLMNEKAKNIGLKNTHFVNPSGLHDDNQYTTAYDMAKIMQYALRYPIFLQISSSVSYRHAPIRKYKNPDNSNNTILNTNSIMVHGSGYYYNGITAGKTGHTSLAGYNLAASAKRDGMHLICVCLGANSEKQRFTDAKNLFDYYFDNYSSYAIKDFDKRFNTPIDTFSINDVSVLNTLNITCNESAHITIPKSTNLQDIKSKITYQVKDIYNRYAIGYITYTLSGEFVGECTLEGHNFETGEPIFTNYLNLTKYNVESEDTEEKTDENKNNQYSNALIYKNANGALVISKTLITFINILIAFIILVLLSFFFYTKILANENFSLNKLFFRIRRYFKNK